MLSEVLLLTLYGWRLEWNMPYSQEAQWQSRAVKVGARWGQKVKEQIMVLEKYFWNAENALLVSPKFLLTISFTNVRLDSWMTRILVGSSEDESESKESEDQRLVRLTNKQKNTEKTFWTERFKKTFNHGDKLSPSSRFRTQRTFAHSKFYYCSVS